MLTIYDLLVVVDIASEKCVQLEMSQKIEHALGMEQSFIGSLRGYLRLYDAASVRWETARAITGWVTPLPAVDREELLAWAGRYEEMAFEPFMFGTPSQARRRRISQARAP